MTSCSVPRCQQLTALDEAGWCYYHNKIEQGLLGPSTRKWNSTIETDDGALSIAEVAELQRSGRSVA
jgi:hypothetical protein